MKRLVPFLIFVLATAGLVAFIYKDKLFPPNPEDAAKKAEGASGGGGRRGGGGGGGGRRRSDVVPVLTDKVRTDNVPVYLSGVGTVQAYNTATIRAQVSGRLTEVAFQEGQDVKKSDILARIDPVLYQAVYDQAMAKKATDEALLANARLDEKRYVGLAKSDYSSQQQADTAGANVRQYEGLVRQDQASIDNAKANLDYTTVRAPFDGRTGLRLLDAGNLVSANDTTGIVVITQLKPISVVFTLPEDNVGPVIEAQTKAALPLQAITNGVVIAEGKLEVIDNQIDQTTGTFRLKGTFANEQFRLWPGQFVNVKLRLKTLENAIVAPSIAIQQGANGSFVYVVTPESTVKLTNVKVFQEGERQSVITEGIAAGDTVVTSGFTNLNDGTKVRIETLQAADAANGEQKPGSAPPNTPSDPAANPGDKDKGGEGRHKRRQGADDGGEHGEGQKDGKGKRRRGNQEDGAPGQTPPQGQAPSANAPQTNAPRP